MARVTSSVLLAAGTLLLVTWLVSPAASAPPQQLTVDAPPVAAAPELDEINREVDRLRERLATTAVAAPPARDPFQFAPLLSTRRSDTPEDFRPPIVFEPAIVWPELVAILSSASPSIPTHQAAFEDNAHAIQILSAGGVLDGFVIDSVTADAVVLSHPATGRTSQLSLR